MSKKVSKEYNFVAVLKNAEVIKNGSMRSTSVKDCSFSFGSSKYSVFYAVVMMKLSHGEVTVTYKFAD